MKIRLLHEQRQAFEKTLVNKLMHYELQLMLRDLLKQNPTNSGDILTITLEYFGSEKWPIYLMLNEIDITLDPTDKFYEYQ